MRRKTLGILASLQARNSLQFNALMVLFRQKRNDEMPVVQGKSEGESGQGIRPCHEEWGLK